MKTPLFKNVIKNVKNILILCYKLKCVSQYDISAKV